MKTKRKKPVGLSGPALRLEHVSDFIAILLSECSFLNANLFGGQVREHDTCVKLSSQFVGVDSLLKPYAFWGGKLDSQTFTG